MPWVRRLTGRGKVRSLQCRLVHLARKIHVDDLPGLRRLTQAIDRNHRLVASQHGFFADYRQSYNPADAKLAWKRSLAWLKKSGVAV